MNVKILPSKLSGHIQAIASKSYAHRTLIAAALSDRPTTFHLNSMSQDIHATINALGCLGSHITIEDDKVTVNPINLKENPSVFCKESGTTARLLLPVMAAICDKGTLSGEGSLLNRPFEALCNAISENGCNFESKHMPIYFSGKMEPGDYRITGKESSQYVSALMFALPLLNGNSRIVLTSPLQSSGYVDVTLDVLRQFSIKSGYEIEGKQKFISPSIINVEGDWSNAAFWIAAGVEDTSLNKDSLQKDKLFLTLRNQREIDVADVPDLVPILAVCATLSNKVTFFNNANRLQFKESNRLNTTSKMLVNLGADVEVKDDGLIVYGKGKLLGGITDSYNDHRIAMAAAIASCFCENEVVITNADAVNKSYPEFFTHFNSLGGRAHVI